MAATPKNDPVKKQDFSMPIEKIMRPAYLLTLIISVVWVGVFLMVHGWSELVHKLFLKTMLVIPAFAVGIVLHEALHGISFIVFGKKKLRDISFGFNRKNLTPYAHCHKPLRAWAYRISALMPGILLGFLPFAYSLTTASNFWLFFSWLLTTGAIGDFLMIWKIRKVSSRRYVEDHPSQLGCYVYPQGYEL